MKDESFKDGRISDEVSITLTQDGVNNDEGMEFGEFLTKYITGFYKEPTKCITLNSEVNADGKTVYYTSNSELPVLSLKTPNSKDIFTIKRSILDGNSRSYSADFSGSLKAISIESTGEVSANNISVTNGGSFNTVSADSVSAGSVKVNNEEVYSPSNKPVLYRQTFRLKNTSIDICFTIVNDRKINISYSDGNTKLNQFLISGTTEPFGNVMVSASGIYPNNGTEEPIVMITIGSDGEKITVFTTKDNYPISLTDFLHDDLTTSLAKELIPYNTKN